MRLTQKEKDILSYVQLRARAPLPTIAKETGYRTHVVRHCLQNFFDSGTIRLRPFIDVERVGLAEYTVYCSFDPESIKGRKSPAAKICAIKQVSAVRALVGKYDCSITLHARTPRELNNILQQVRKETGAVISEKTVLLHTDHTIYRRKYLSSNIQGTKTLYRANYGQTLELDGLDLRILSRIGMATTAYSYRQLSKELVTSHSTIAFRVQRLERHGVILGWTYAVDLDKIEIQQYRILLSFNDFTPHPESTFKIFCKHHKNVVGLVEAVGQWDVELWVEVEKAKQLVQLRHDFYERFGARISKFEVLSVLEEELGPPCAVSSFVQDQSPQV